MFHQEPDVEAEIASSACGASTYLSSRYLLYEVSGLCNQTLELHVITTLTIVGILLYQYDEIINKYMSLYSMYSMYVECRYRIIYVQPDLLSILVYITTGICTRPCILGGGGGL